MVAAARREGVVLRGLGQYYMARRELCPASTVVLGYASLKDQDIPALVQALRRAWGTVRQKISTGRALPVDGDCRKRLTPFPPKGDSLRSAPRPLTGPATLAPRKVFFRRTRRRKNDLIFFRRLRATELCEAFSTH